MNGGSATTSTRILRPSSGRPKGDSAKANPRAPTTRSGWPPHNCHTPMPSWAQVGACGEATMANDEATALTPEPLSAPAQEPSSGQPLSSQTAFFRVPREGTPYFIAFAAKLSPGLATDGATSYVPATVKGRTSDRLKRAVK